MTEYRKNLPEVGGTYNVELGGLPELPLWHPQAHPNRWPFPNAEAAERFANARKSERPDREVAILTPGGSRRVL
ncbi:hypothetical protein SEA_STEAMY_67 [Mycobacterium phage Steamy]|uniref:Uncharacterized protein n=1 Tax=Mycobacterium phage Steamy TaxID=2250309 RepID=A0A345L0N9_9CAUD|nr:hypothetical protein KIV62_gp34 [Mycobacterium phage Steamy]AXH48841.1 hypothetical protein SEA_STEAMY_67 [Mycobacterium phage Steamy]